MGKRRLTEAEKLSRKTERLNAKERAKAEQATAALKAEAGPLFAHEVEPVRAVNLSPRDVYWKGRFDHARGVEGLARVVGPAIDALDWLRVRKRERRAAELLSQDDFAAAKLRADSLARYGPAYCLDCWYQALKHLPGLKEEMLAEIAAISAKPIPFDDGGSMEQISRLLCGTKAGCR